MMNQTQRRGLFWLLMGIAICLKFPDMTWVNDKLVLLAVLIFLIGGYIMFVHTKDQGKDLQ